MRYAYSGSTDFLEQLQRLAKCKLSIIKFCNQLQKCSLSKKVNPILEGFRLLVIFNCEIILQIIEKVVSLPVKNFRLQKILKKNSKVNKKTKNKKMEICKEEVKCRLRGLV